jgi:Ca2+-binding RTX toxin-like protein
MRQVDLIQSEARSEEHHMTTATRHGRFVAVVACLAAATGGSWAIAGPASAGVVDSCGYAAGVVTATIAADANAGLSAFIHTTNVTNEIVLDVIDSNDESNNTTIDCGAATALNTDTINVTGSSDDNTLFMHDIQPGATSESGVEEVEWNVDLGVGEDLLGVELGTSATAGALGVNLNADTDADVTVANLETLLLDGEFMDEPLTLSGAGGNGTGAPYAGDMILRGGSENDRLFGGSGNDTINGGPGDDAELGFSGDDGLGDDGSIPDSGRNLMKGGAGSDGFANPSGVGTVSYANYTVPIHATLDNDDNDGQAGEHDNLDASISRVIGGSAADVINATSGAMSADPIPVTLVGKSGPDRLTGGPLGDTLAGGRGGDMIAGAAGRDDLSGGSGDDALRGGTGVDGLDGGSGDDVCNGGPSADVFEHCETKS